MTGFHEVRFPDAIARGATGGPGYDTTIITTAAGFERRNANWALPRGRWDVGSGLRSRADLEVLIAFFRARQGRAWGFRFKDWTDYRATGAVLGFGDGTTAAFQLVKRYASGPVEVVRDITKPVAGSVTVRADGAPVSGVTVDATKGIVTFATPPTAGTAIMADFEFDVPVRFDTDAMALSLDSYERGSWQQIPIQEIRP
jgi:uncharacterized protein (TIGR02217 family)